jgi:predicted dehydrogenase
MVLGTHLLDMMRFFAGDPEWVFGCVTRDGADVSREDVRDATEPIGPVAGDAVLGVFGFPGGVQGIFRSVRNRTAGGTRWGVTCTGTKGVISMLYADSPTASICRNELLLEKGGVYEKLDIEREPDIPGADPLETVTFHTRGNRLAVCDLMEAAEKGREPLSGGRDALWALEMIMGVYRSHLDKRRVSFPLSERSHPLA